jgi:hypothetical protein
MRRETVFIPPVTYLPFHATRIYKATFYTFLLQRGDNPSDIVYCPDWQKHPKL